jgi:fatty-acyl-CoA synthase
VTMITVQRTLPARIEANAHRGALTFVGAGEPRRVPWAQIHDQARGVAGALQARGVEPGDHVALLGPTSESLVVATQAVWLAGAAVVALPLPMRLASLDEFVAQTRQRIRSAGCRLVLVDPELAAFLEPQPGDPPLVLLGSLDPAPLDRPADDPDATAILQFTSGSTADPKGVVLPHRCIAANHDAMYEAVGLLDDDVFVSWLPLYHDMGLIGFLGLPMVTGADLVLAAPQDFLAAPARWLHWLSDHRGTITAAPNFAYALAARALRREEGLDLSHLRIALNGAEAVDAETVAAFVEAGARHGLRPGAPFPAFGMAEATLAVTFPPPGRGLVTDVVDRHALEHERRAVAVDPSRPESRDHRTMVRLGTPLPGFELRIVEPDTGEVLADRCVGEMELRGPSVTPGYHDRPDATAEARRDGWLRTGDLAYTVDGELVVCGRIKDVIIVGGRNVFPEDVERAASDVDGVRTGNVIAFGHRGRRGREAIVVVAEIRHDDATLVRELVAKRVTDAIGLPPEEVVLVAAGTLPKTSSGKLQRALCHQRWQAGELVPL